MELVPATPDRSIKPLRGSGRRSFIASLTLQHPIVRSSLSGYLLRKPVITGSYTLGFERSSVRRLICPENLRLMGVPQRKAADSLPFERLPASGSSPGRSKPTIRERFEVGVPLSLWFSPPRGRRTQVADPITCQAEPRSFLRYRSASPPVRSPFRAVQSATTLGLPTKANEPLPVEQVKGCLGCQRAVALACTTRSGEEKSKSRGFFCRGCDCEPPTSDVDGGVVVSVRLVAAGTVELCLGDAAEL